MGEKKRFGMVKMGIYEAGGTDESAKNITFEQKMQKKSKNICAIQKIIVSLHASWCTRKAYVCTQCIKWY